LNVAIKSIDVRAMKVDGIPLIVLQLAKISLEEFINVKMIQDAVVDKLVELPTDTMQNAQDEDFQAKLLLFIDDLNMSGESMLLHLDVFDKEVAQQLLDVGRIAATLRNDFTTRPKTPILLQESFQAYRQSTSQEGRSLQSLSHLSSWQDDAQGHRGRAETWH
jgi:hypothetical protein